MIGASAGGLEPISKFLDAMPADSGAVFIVIQHLDPAGKSLLPELLARHTRMQVQLASEGAALLPNQVYVIPPGVFLSLVSDKFHMVDAPSGAGARLPVDVFLRSLAANCRNRGIGIILSGTGTDGSQGLKLLKEAGGLTLVQEPSEAQHDGMPQQAILMASPDHVMPVADMPRALLQYIARGCVKPPHEEDHGGDGMRHIAAVLDTLKSVTGRDFEQYKTGTVQRRIERRMGLHAIESWEDYIALLHRNTAEAEALAKDLLIHVTQFFRDPDAFAFLAQRILPGLLSKHSPDQPVRIWVPGCSTGEEAYTLGMVFLEQIAQAPQRLKLQIFATDIDEEGLQAARAGIYPESIRADISPQRLGKFFTAVDRGFKITNGLRESVIFSRHDLLKDPPFSRLDLISCRNLFIYLRPDAQELVLTMFHFALRDDGLLFLGTAESSGAAADLFKPVDPAQRLYRRIGQTRGPRVGLQPGSSGIQRSQINHAVRSKMPQPPLAELVERKILEVYAPASVVTNRQHIALYFSGAIDRYLQVAPGEPQQDVLSMAREGLRPMLRETIGSAFRGKRPVSVHGVRCKHGSKQVKVTIEAQLIDDDLALVSFIDEPPDMSGMAEPSTGDAVHSAAFAEMQQELADTRKELNRTIRELRRTNEDMMAANEEAVSLNEELLSANEELETSKEELQSLNEELTTLNGQLRQSLDQQQQISTDLANLLNSSGVATLFLDSQLNIKVFNPAMQSLFAIIEKDIGRPIADLLPKFADPNLLQDAIQARSNGAPIEREVQAQSGTWYLRTVLPYRTASGDIQGEVVTFTDVSQLKTATLTAAAARSYAEAIVDTIREPLAVVDLAMKVLSVNTAFAISFGLTIEAIQGKTLSEAGIGILRHKKLHELLARVSRNQSGTGAAELEVEQPNGGLRVWRATARNFAPAPAEPPMILLVLNDITDRQLILHRQMQMMLDALPGAVVAVDDQRLIRFVNHLVEPLFGYSPGELAGQNIEVLLPTALRARHEQLHSDYMAQMPTARQMGVGLDIKGLTRGGGEIPLEIGLSPVATSDGTLILATILDLRGQKAAETRLREAMAGADRANQAKSRFLAAASHDLRQPLQTIGLLLGVLAKRTAGPEAQAIVGKLENTISGMSELLDTLLDINQIESGGVRPDITDFAVAGFFTRLSDLYGPIAAAKGLELRVVPSSAVIRSDHHLLERVVGNLLSNAIKYTDRGRILLGCRHSGNKLRIEVWDTGIGIPEESTAKVFEEFHRLNPEDSSRFGLGIGLYIVQRLALLLDHKIEVRSHSGKGTMFAVIAAAGDQAAWPRTARREQAISGAKPPTILLIEDDPNQLESLRLLLETEGYRVLAVRKGEEALALADNAEGQPDVIAADYNLPGGMNGLQVIKGLRSGLGVQIPALIVSGDKSASARQAFKASAQAFITKPVKAAELLATLAALVETVRPGWSGKQLMNYPVSATASTAGAEIGVVDDDPGVCDAIRHTLEAEGHKVDTYASCEAFLAEPDHGKYRCLVVDVGLGDRGIDGLELQRLLKEEHINTPVIFVTGSGDLPKAVKAIRDGAVDFLLKPVKGTELYASVSRALAHVASEGSNHAKQQETDARLATLTARERQVMERIAAGEASKVIAADLRISQRTVEHHRQSVMRKMAVKSLAALVRKVGLRTPTE
ncbi:hypothetical protein GCM10010909_15690 [Acidocella aquatica]|uniref:histidine kinase n=1 Tax=Acidocella aquatica TaxID=1922313 RepID=A0ABQ6A402_9PROT|nr:chemotaxis protein CheB [Acidocella aquatica]GLR66889.1 hypothetical protein GCM10010909_15690 [Acidocella aquatica]